MILFSAMACGICASLAFAEPLPSGNSKDEVAVARPLALTDTQMDKVTAGSPPGAVDALLKIVLLTDPTKIGEELPSSKGAAPGVLDGLADGVLDEIPAVR